MRSHGAPRLGVGLPIIHGNTVAPPWPCPALSGPSVRPATPGTGTAAAVRSRPAGNEAPESPPPGDRALAADCRSGRAGLPSSASAPGGDSWFTIAGDPSPAAQAINRPLHDCTRATKLPTRCRVCAAGGARLRASCKLPRGREAAPALL